MPEMSADILSMPEGPALSATSDTPVVTPVEASVVDAVADVPAAPVAADPAAVAEPVAPVDGDGAAGDDGEPVEPAKPRAATRMSELATQRRLAEEQRAAADARADRLAEMVATLIAERRPAEPVVSVEPRSPKPQRETFDDPDSYDAALMEWVATETARETSERVTADLTKRAAEQKAEQDQLAAEEVARKEGEAQVATWNERRAKAIAEKPDFVDVAEGDFPFPMTAVPALMQVENGPDVLYHLGSNHAEAARLASLSPLQQAIEIGRISAMLAQPARAAAPKLPAPVKPVGPRNNGGQREETTEEYGNRRLQELRSQSRPGMFGRTG